MINIYRAITGPGYAENGEWLFTGLDKEQIFRYGICNENWSEAQTRRYPSNDPLKRRVPGLPVFLDQSQAEFWLVSKKFRHIAKGLAVIACAHIDESDIDDGSIQIFRNIGGDLDNADRLLTLDDLKAPEGSRTLLRGECYIPNFPCERMLEHTTFLVAAAHNLDGSIDFSQEPAFTDLANF